MIPPIVVVYLAIFLMVTVLTITALIGYSCLQAIGSSYQPASYRILMTMLFVIWSGLSAFTIFGACFLIGKVLSKPQVQPPVPIPLEEQSLRRFYQQISTNDL